MTLARRLGDHPSHSADALSKEALSASEIQQIQDRFKIDYIAPINLEFAHSMRRILHIELSARYREKDAIANILEGKIHKAFETGIIFAETEDKGSHFRYSLEHPSIDHLFDNNKLFSCTLQPLGANKEQAALLINDPYAAMVHVRKITKNDAEKVALSYSFLMDGWETLMPIFIPIFFSRGIFPVPTGQRKDVLLVDDVNGYMGNVDRNWRTHFKSAHEQLAQLTKSETIAYGTRHGQNTATAESMDRFVAKNAPGATYTKGYFRKKIVSFGSSPDVYISNLIRAGKHYGRGECKVYSYPTPQK